MSNKIVPQIYRAIIDDVIANVAVDFEEYGMDDDLLPMLQSKWESKLLETRVAEFARAPGAGDDAGAAAANASQPPSAPPASSNGSYTTGAPSVLMPGAPSSQPTFDGVQVKPEPEDVLRLRGGASNESPATLPDYKPEPRPDPNAAGLLPGDEVIDSDLDDSDDELGDDEDGEEEGDIDIVFCVYDKVTRVKTKWKTVLKDGMIHINGRDYLFAKCQGEFEW